MHSNLFTVADDFQIWPHIADELIRRLPLRDVIWTHPTIKSSQLQKKLSIVDVELKRFSMDLFPKTNLIHETSPYFLHLYFINCEVIS